MAGLLSKIVLSSAFVSSLVFSIPATTTYTRPDDSGVAITAEITSYSSEPGQTDDTPFITASGTHVHDGTLACPMRYAFGTVVLIDGKEYVCEDRMNQAKFPERFDVWNASTTKAIAWGVKMMRVVIR